MPLPPWVLTRRQLLRAALLREDEELELPRPGHAHVRVGRLRRQEGDLQRQLRRAQDRPARSWASDAKKALLLGKATFEPPLHKRAPHHLARDDGGRYFYVDKGNTSDTEKNFRLFVGPKGAMKLQKMTNAVADTEGEIFTTKSRLAPLRDRPQEPAGLDPGRARS